MTLEQALSCNSVSYYTDSEGEFMLEPQPDGEPVISWHAWKPKDHVFGWRPVPVEMKVPMDGWHHADGCSCDACSSGGAV